MPRWGFALALEACFCFCCRRRTREEIEGLATAPTKVLQVDRVKPVRALELLREELGDDPAKRAKWRGEARVASIMGSCPASRARFKSGVRHWLEFIEVTYGRPMCDKQAFPPTLGDVLAWANVFACSDTFSNYLTHLRGACHATGFEAPPTRHPALSRAVVAILKRELFVARQKRFINRTMMANMVAAVRNGREELHYAMLWLLAYTFLLRLPSEALPACKGEPTNESLLQQQTLIWREGDCVCLRLLRRKNMRQGSGILKRKCSCKDAATDFNRDTCVVHSLWDRFFDKMPEGSQPWRKVTANKARARLREVLTNLDVPEPDTYATHDFRRGHAEDLRRSGASLSEILKAGQWRSAAFMSYLDADELNKAMSVFPISHSIKVRCLSVVQDVAFAMAINEVDEEWCH